MDEEDARAGFRVVQLGDPDAHTGVLMNSLCSRSGFNFSQYVISPDFEGNQP